ncbi:MAG: ribonuclease T2 family protein [Steroidobacteraceae bacterium]
MHGASVPLRRARVLLLLLGLLAVAAARAAPLQATQHADFTHYTFALTWQPGFCSTDGGCLHTQPHSILIGLHGLWASRPQALIDRGISAAQWWRRGCDYYRHSDSSPQLPPATLRRLNALLPRLKDSLLRHEYDKHVQCFGFDAQTYFQTELRMHREVTQSAFGRYLTMTARGREVRRADMIQEFMRAFGTDQSSALQLRCGRDPQRRVVLTQLWITLHSDAVARFPRGGALMNAPIPQDNCPARFQLPDWQ